MYSVYVISDVLKSHSHSIEKRKSPTSEENRAASLVEKALSEQIELFTDDLISAPKLKNKVTPFSISLFFSTVIEGRYLKLKQPLLFINDNTLNGCSFRLGNKEAKLSLLFDSDKPASTSALYDIIELYLPLHWHKSPTHAIFQFFDKRNNNTYTPLISLKRAFNSDSLVIFSPSIHRFNPEERDEALHLSIIHIKDSISAIFAETHVDLSVFFNSPGTDAINLNGGAVVDYFKSTHTPFPVYSRFLFELKSRALDGSTKLNDVLSYIKTNLGTDYINFNFFKSPINEDYLFYTFSCFKGRKRILTFNLTIFDQAVAYEILGGSNAKLYNLFLDKGLNNTDAFKPADWKNPFQPYYTNTPRITYSLIFVKYDKNTSLNTKTAPVDLSHLDSFIAKKNDVTNRLTGIFIPSVDLPSDPEERNKRAFQAVDELLEENINWNSEPYLFKERFVNELALASIPEKGQIEDVSEEGRYGVLVVNTPQAMINEFIDLGILRKSGDAGESTFMQLKKLFPLLFSSSKSTKISFIYPSQKNNKDSESPKI